MTSIPLTEYLRKLKNEVGRNSTVNRETFQNDEEKCFESASIVALTQSQAPNNLVTCRGEPSSFRMDRVINANRRESEDSLWKFAVHFSRDHNSSLTGGSDTTSSQHNEHGNNIHGKALPTLERSDAGIGGENVTNDGKDLMNNQPNDQLSSDAINGVDHTNPDTNEWCECENGESDTLNANDDDGDKSSPSKESQSSSSTPRASNNGVNSHDKRLRHRGVNENKNRDHVTIGIQVENEQESFQTPTGHMESYLYIMQFLGISNFRRVEYRSLNAVLTILLKVLFWIVSTGAFLNSLKILKRVAIQQAPTDKDLKYCVTIGFAMIRCFSRFYFIKIAGTQAEKLSVMLLHIRNLRIFTYDGEFSFSILAVILATTTFFITFIKVLFGYLSFNAWSWNKALKMRTFFLSSTLFAWSSDKNVTAALAQTFFYSDDITLAYAVMGILEGFLDFCGTLQGEAIRDLLILAGLTILIDQKHFDQRIQPQLLVHPNNTDAAEVEGSLRHFKCVCQESSSINDTLVTSFKFVTIQNLLLFAYLFVQLIGYDGMNIILIHSIVDALRGLVLFYIGMRLHWKNSNIKRWLHQMSSYTGPVDVEAILGMSVQSAIAELRDDPIGLGSDYFLINETFIVGLVAAVGSLISLLFEFDKQQATIRRLAL